MISLILIGSFKESLKRPEMLKLYSLVKPNTLLHVISRVEDIIEGRADLIPENNYLQCSLLKYPEGKTFKPHKHKWHPPFTDTVIAQESWVIVQGRVKVIYYDLDDSILCEEVLDWGDSSFTLQGGHNYVILDPDTIVYEFKTGPYKDQQSDKEFI